MSTRIIIGIDPGYARCGFGIIVENNCDWEVLGHGVMMTTPESEHGDRLAEIAKDFAGLLKQYQPQELVIEELFFAKSTTTALKVAEVRGVIIMKAKEAGLKVIEVKPNEVKLALTGYGKADKKQMQEMVKII